MTDLPPELALFAALLDAHLCPRPVPSRGGLRHKCRQPASVGDAFNYLLCTLMVEAGKMRLVEQVSGEVRLSLATFPAEF